MNCFTHKAHLSWNKCSHAPLSKQETYVQQQRLNLNSESVKTSKMSAERVKEKTSNQHLWAPNNLQWIYNTEQFTACGFPVTKCEDGWHSLTNLSVHPSKCLSLHWEVQRVSKTTDKSRRQIYRCEQVCKWRSLPWAVGNLHTDAVALLTTTLRRWVVTGSGPTQTGAGAAPIVMTTHGPAGPGAEASIDRHITDLLGTKKGPRNKTFESNSFSQNLVVAFDWCSQECVALGNASHGYSGWKQKSIFFK